MNVLKRMGDVNSEKRLTYVFQISNRIEYLVDRHGLPLADFIKSIKEIELKGAEANLKNIRIEWTGDYDAACLVVVGDKEEPEEDYQKRMQKVQTKKQKKIKELEKKKAELEKQLAELK